MGIGRQSSRLNFLPEVMHLVFGQPTLEECACINARCDVPLDIKKISTMVFGRRMEEMVEADIIECRGRGEARDMSAESRVVAIGLNDHRHGVPANEGTDPFFQRLISGTRLLERFGDRVDIGGRRAVRKMRALPSGAAHEAADQKMRAFNALALEHCIERFEPLPSLLGIAIAESDILRIRLRI